MNKPVLHTFCKVCQSVASAIESYYRVIDANSNSVSLQPHQEPEAYKEIILGSIKDLKSKTDYASCQDIVAKFVKDGIQPSPQSRLRFEPQ